MWKVEVQLKNGEKIPLLVNRMKNRENRLFVCNPFTHEWTAGFYSYDKKGLIFDNGRGWTFVKCNKIWWLDPNGKEIETRFGVSLQERIDQGIETEKFVLSDLERYIREYDLFLHHLERSGQHGRGSDIVISEHEQPHKYQWETVKNSICAIEVVSVIEKNKNKIPYLKYGDHKNFYAFLTNHIYTGTLTCVSYVMGTRVHHILLSLNTLYDVFYTRRKIRDKPILRQRKSYVNVKHTYPYRIDSELLLELVNIHRRTQDIIVDINENVPIEVDTFNKNLVLPTSWANQCRDEYFEVLKKLEYWGV